MIRLDLNSRAAMAPIKVPASAFPARADVYECDNCKRDLTKYLRHQHSHTWEPMGPERVRCSCGLIYLTGATEWDHLGEWERRHRIRGTFGLGVVFSVLMSILGLLVYLFLHFVFELRQGAFITWLILAAPPFFLVQISFWPSVLASIWRTRFGSSVVSERPLK